MLDACIYCPPPWKYKKQNTFQIEDIATQPWYIAGPAGTGHDYDKSLMIQIEDIHQQSTNHESPLQTKALIGTFAGAVVGFSGSSASCGREHILVCVMCFAERFFNCVYM